MVIHTDDAVQSNLVVKMASKHGLKSKKTKISWSGKDGVVVSGDSNKLKKFMSAVEKISEGTVSEKYKPYTDKTYSRCVDFYIQFRGGKGDRITSEENKKDYETAKKMIDTYCRTNKIKQKPVYSTPEEGSSAYKVGLMIDKTYSKTDDYDRGVDLQPLYVALSKLKTAEDHGGGWDKATPSNSRRLKGAVIEKIEKVLTTEQTISEAPKLKNLMPEFEKIVKTKGAAKVQGTMVDMFTASVIVKAYNQVNDKNKKRMETSNVFTLIKLAQKVMGLKEANLTQLKRKHKRHIDAFNKRNKDLPKKVEDELFQYAMDNDNIGDDPDDFDDWLVQNIEESVNLNEGMSKLLSPAQQKGVLKKWNEPEGSTFAKDVYSNAKIANKKDFIVTSHSVKDGDYYLSLLGNAPEGKEDKPLTKANTNMNADIRKICKKWSTAGKTSPNPAGMCFLEIERELCDKKYNNFAAADTMVREVVWGMVEDIMGIKIKTA